MLAPEGIDLTVELIAGVFLLVGIAGFGFRRTTPWLLVSGLAFAVLLVAVTLVVDSSA